MTGDNVGRDLAIILDGRVQSAPLIEGRIDGGEGHIRGRFTQQEAADLSLVLRAGALPASMTYLGGRFVGPSLGSASIDAGVVASLAGLALVAAFMLLYYNRAGINALVSVAVNLLLLLGLHGVFRRRFDAAWHRRPDPHHRYGRGLERADFRAHQGGAGGGQGARAAVAAGFDRVFLTILDTHVASLIAAAFLFQFGTGPIRGFATTLTFGLLANVFTAVFVSRTLFEAVLSRGREARLRMQTFTRLFRIAGCRLPPLALARAVALDGRDPGGAWRLTMARGGIPLGIEFSGGTIVTVKFAQPVAEEAMQYAIPGEETVQRYGDPADNEMLIRLPQIRGSRGRDAGAARRVERSRRFRPRAFPSSK